MKHLFRYFVVFCYCGIANTGNRSKRSTYTAYFLSSMLLFDLLVILFSVIQVVKMSLEAYVILSPILIYSIFYVLKRGFKKFEFNKYCLPIYDSMNKHTKVLLGIVSVVFNLLVMASWYGSLFVFSLYFRV